MRRLLSVFLPVLLFLLLLFFPALAIEGASNGLLLWYRRVLPVLLPFALVSHLMVETHLPEALSPRLCVILLGFACGYPMGALWASALAESKQISKAEGERLLLFCNQPSPMFLTGYLGLQALQLPSTGALLLCAYLPPLLLGALLMRRLPLPAPRKNCSFTPLSIQSFEKAWLDSCQILVRIGGYIMLFSILAAIVGHFLRGHMNLKPFLIGIFEMTTGIGLLAESTLGMPLKGAIGLFLACFGGLSTLAQTTSCLMDGPLRGKHYLSVRLLCGLLSATFYYILWNIR